jgi:hypothetical protein
MGEIMMGDAGNGNWKGGGRLGAIKSVAFSPKRLPFPKISFQ